MIRIVIASFVLPLMGCEPHGSVYILSQEYGPKMLQQCSRHAPMAQSFWTPDLTSVSDAEARLSQVRDMNPAVTDPTSGSRQYVGIHMAGRRFLYVNAVSEDVRGEEFDKPLIVCDGGAAFWGAIYDVELQMFIDISINATI